MLQNAQWLQVFAQYSFGGTGTTNAFSFLVDPDGYAAEGTANGIGKSVVFFLYYDGSLRTKGTIEPNTYSSNPSSPFNPTPAYDPSWFSWE